MVLLHHRLALGGGEASGTEESIEEVMADVTWSTYVLSSVQLMERGRGTARGWREEESKDTSNDLSAFFQFRRGAGGSRGLSGLGRLRVVRMSAWSDEYGCSKESSVTHEVARS